MSAKQSKWLQFVPVLVMVIGIVAACITMSTESAVRAEQIRTIQDDTLGLHADGEKQDVRMHEVEREIGSRIGTVEREMGSRIGTVEKDMAGIIPAVDAVKAIAEKNATKLDALLLRGQ